MNFWIDGDWQTSSAKDWLEVKNPTTDEVIDSVPLGTAEDADKAVRSAAKAFKSWRKTPTAERVRLQHKAATLMRENLEDLAHLLTLELGRPLSGSKREIERSADLLDYYAEEGLRVKGELPMLAEVDQRVMVVKEAIGVVVAIAPFNYPITLLTFKLGAALITGCTVVAKPAEDTPLTTLKLAELFTQAGYPDGVFNVVTGLGQVVGQALVTHAIPRKVAFTGSTAAGKRIRELVSPTNKRLTLELGGQSPAIVCKDADLSKAVEALVRHSFANSGQFCYRVNRIYIEQAIYEDFIEAFKTLTSNLIVGDGLNPSCQLGPMINQKIFETSERHVADALAKGARLVTGGKRLTGLEYDKGWFFPPTMLTDTTHAMQIMTEETFGPVVGIAPFESLEDALEKANDTRYGLAAYIFTKDIGIGLRAAEELEAGSVWVNNIQRSYNMVPFGGYKESGLGREKSAYGLEAYLELKTIYLGF